MTVICDPHAPAYGFSAEISIHDCSPGLTKRELFAAMAMQGLLAFDGGMAKEWNGSVNSNTERNDRLVGRSRRIADALIKELSK